MKVLADPTSEEGGDAAAASAAPVEFAAGSPASGTRPWPASSRGSSSSASPAPPSSRRSSGSRAASRRDRRAPELAPELTERDGARHEVRRWFAWYYGDGGGDRTTNSGEKPYGGLLAFDLGEEMQSGQSVREEILKRLEVTVPLSLVAVLLSYIIALPLGIASVRRQGTAVDGGLTIVLFVLYSIPTFWAGLMLVLIFGRTGADLLPILGLHDKDADPANTLAYAWDTVLHCILPVLTLTYGSLAYLSRQMRAGMLDVIRQDYIRTAKAKGLSDDRSCTATPCGTR